MSWSYSPMQAKHICNMNMVDPGPDFDDVPKHQPKVNWKVAEVPTRNKVAPSPTGSKAAPPPTSAVTVETQDKLDTIIQILADLSERVKALERGVSNLTGHTTEVLEEY